MITIDIARPGENEELAHAIRATTHELICEGHCGEQLIGNCTLEPGEPHQGDFNAIQFRARWGQATVATGRLLLPPTPSASVYRELNWTLDGPRSQRAEPSRVANDKRITDLRVRRAAVYELVGAITALSLESGFWWWPMEIRFPLFDALWWFPFELLQPTLHYPPEVGGPDTSIPVMGAKLFVPEVVAATALLRPDVAQMMFPVGLPDIRAHTVRGRSDYEIIARANRRQVASWKTAFENGTLQSHTVQGQVSASE